MEKIVDRSNTYLCLNIIGNQRAGKSTIGKLVAKNYDSIHIEISNIVKAYVDDPENREELLKTARFTKENPNWLGQMVEDFILTHPVSEYLYSPPKVVVLTGMREPEVYNYLIHQGIHTVTVFIECDKTIRFIRAKKHQPDLKLAEFELNDKKENEMGLKQIPWQLKLFSDETTDPEVLAELICNDTKELLFN